MSLILLRCKWPIELIVVLLGPLLIGSAYDRAVHCRNRRYSSGGATVAYFVLVGVWLSFTPLIAQVHTMKIYCAILALNSIFYVIFNCCEARTVNCTSAIEHRNEIAKCFLTVSNYDADLEVCVRSSLFIWVELFSPVAEGVPVWKKCARSFSSLSWTRPCGITEKWG